MGFPLFRQRVGEDMVKAHQVASKELLEADNMNQNTARDREGKGTQKGTQKGT